MHARVWDDSRVVAGMSAQLDRRRGALAKGRFHRGWKLGLGAPAMREQLGLAAPLLGYLLADSELPSDAHVSLSGWTKPMLEAEVAVQMRSDLAGGAGMDQARNAIEGIAPAIEVADIDAPLDDAEAALKVNLFQRHFILGPLDTSWDARTLRTFASRIRVNGEVVQSMPDPTTLTGGLVENVRHVADYLAAFGLVLRQGDVIITGSITPPLFVAPGQQVTTETDGLGSLSVTFSAR